VFEEPFRNWDIHNSEFYSAADEGDPVISKNNRDRVIDIIQDLPRKRKA